MKITTADFFILYADCKLVKGQNRSIIYDLTRNTFSILPNTLYKILTEDFELRIVDIIKKYGENYKDIILEYFEFLIDKEYIFTTKTSEERVNFPALDTSYESPYTITNVIIDYKDAKHPIQDVVEQLESLGSVHLQLRFLSREMIPELDNILNATLDSRIKSIELIMPFDKSINLEVLLEKHRRVHTVILHSSDKNDVIEIGDILVQMVVDQINTQKCCGQIQLANFSVDRSFFNETSNYNNCLHKKIAIDSDGKIKNCPSMQKAFGLVGEDKLGDIAKNSCFQKIWGVKKTMLKTCNVCEYRNMCLDCRAYTEDANDPFSKPLKCGYDPYTNKWEKWSDNPLKKRTIDHYGLREIIKVNHNNKIIL